MASQISKQVTDAVGPEVEQYVYQFATFEWNQETIPASRDNLDTFGPIDRNVVLLHLADALEHHLDLGVLYFGDSERRRRWVDRNGPVVVEIAEKLGFPALTADLEIVFKETALAHIPVEIRSPSSRNGSFLIAPKSCRMRFSLSITAAIERLRSAMPVRTRFRQLVRHFNADVFGNE